MEFLNNLNGGELIAVVAIVCGIGCGVVAIICDYWHRHRLAETEAALKQQMLDKGMSAAEIVQVLHASTQRKAPKSHCADLNYNKAKLVESLAENGLSGEEIERIVRALDGAPANDRVAEHA